MKLLSFFLLISFALNGESLVFQPGNKAAYRITETAASIEHFMGYVDNKEEQTEFVFDIEVIETNPYLVEITPRRIKFYGTVEEDDEREEFYFDSEDPYLCPHPEFVEAMQNFMGYPLAFRIGKGFEISELTGKLKEINEIAEDQEIGFDITGITPWSYYFFLNELFQLSDQELSLNTSYPVNACPFFNEDSELLDEKEYPIAQSSSYVIHEIDSSKMRGSLQGSALAKPATEEGLLSFLSNFHHAKVDVSADVVWDLENSLLQSRQITFSFEKDYRGFFANKSFITTTQTWESAPIPR